MLQKFYISREKGEKIIISPVLPDKIIKELQELVYFSKDKVRLKCVKSLFYRQIIAYLLLSVLYLGLMLI